MYLPTWLDPGLDTHYEMPDTQPMLLEGLMEPLSDSKQAALQQAAHGGDAQPVQKLLLQGTDVHAQNPKGFTYLMLAAVHGHLKVMQVLLAHTNGHNVDARNHQGQTALMLACDQGQLAAMRILVAYGARYNVQDKGGMIPLMCAACEGHLEVVCELLSLGVDCTERTCHNFAGQIPMTVACQKGHLSVVKALVIKGAEINDTDARGMSGLRYAAGQGKVDVLEFLLQHGANLGQKDADGDTPEQVARDALGRHPTGHSQKVFNVFFQHRQTARRRSSSKYKQQRADELTQIKAQVNEKIKALQAMRKAQLMTALCCLQLPAPHKPRLPQPLVQ